VSFSTFVNTHRFAVVHFWAIWNGYDREMKELLEEHVPLELRNQIAFGRLDVERSEHWEICRQHKVMNVPFLALYRDGTLAGTLTGMREERIIIEHLRRLVSQPEQAGSGCRT
jgi:thioredoxin-like negative regulator of GroEL